MLRKFFGGNKSSAKKGGKETISIESINTISMVLEMKKTSLQTAILSGDEVTTRMLKEQIASLERRLASAR